MLKVQDNIFNIFVYKDENNNNTYLYSKKSKFDDLGYEYHILTRIQKHGFVDKQVPNIIQFFQNKSINITEVKKEMNNIQYLQFLEYYNKIQEQLKEGKRR